MQGWMDGYRGIGGRERGRDRGKEGEREGEEGRGRLREGVRELGNGGKEGRELRTSE